MRKFRRVVLILITFLLVGEAVVRFDQATWFFREYRVNELVNEAHSTPLYTAVAESTFETRAGQWRIMVIGDSYLHGNHIMDEGRFAVRLTERLRAAVPAREIVVLDATVPGGNTCTNAGTFRALRGNFSPHAVVWGYNADDPYGDCDAKNTDTPQRATPSPRSLVSTVRWLQAATYQLSALLGYVGPTVATELEIRGIVVPGTYTHHLFNRSHDPDFPPWRRSRTELEAVAAVCLADDIHLVVLNCPNLAMLGHYGPLEDVDGRIAAYFEGLGVVYLRGIDLFPEQGPEAWAVSRYDGHPNGAAHGVLADGVAEVLITGQRP